MRKILCFGDSNTFGYIPGNGKRYGKNERWPGILQELSAGMFEIMEAGGCNRTGFTDSIDGSEYTGYKILPGLLTDDLYAVIIFIGTNDLQKFYSATEKELQCGLEKMVQTVINKNIKAVIISPANLNKNILTSGFSQMFDETSIKKSFLLAKIYKNVAEKFKCRFLNLNDIVKVSSIDGLHFTKEAHKLIAENVFSIIDKLVI